MRPLFTKDAVAARVADYAAGADPADPGISAGV
jgi:hypothetical protein